MAITKTEHPGHMLADMLSETGFSQKELERVSEIERTKLNKFIHGKVLLSPEECIVLSGIFGNNHSYWWDLQQSWVFETAKKERATQDRLATVMSHVRAYTCQDSVKPLQLC